MAARLATSELLKSVPCKSKHLFRDSASRYRVPRSVCDKEALCGYNLRQSLRSRSEVVWCYLRCGSYMDSDYGNNLTNSHIPVSFRAYLARFWKLPHTDDDDTSMLLNQCCQLYRDQRGFCLASKSSIHSTFITSHLEHKGCIIQDFFIHRYACRINSNLSWPIQVLYAVYELAS